MKFTKLSKKGDFDFHLLIANYGIKKFLNQSDTLTILPITKHLGLKTYYKMRQSCKRSLVIKI